ncbi:MAG: hypothetical protein LBP98_02435, partial [Tannerella sp.]|jgi:hypothetical protein|nr:hypothetical protein [Tannerella sp.]
VADVNRDGKLDVIVSSNNGTNNYGLLVWDPRLKTVIASGGSSGALYPSTPFAGNIDRDPDNRMEILYITQERLHGWRYNGTTTLQRPYQMNHTDGSGATGITLFDFNSDSIPELVYRDQDSVRIMQADAVTGTITNRKAFHCGSGTYKEYPVVADVDGEGSSAILVMGGASGAVSPATLRIYKSDGLPWAPARKVWNQFNYNVVNINEDLTVPRYQFNPATFFPGSDGISGTADDVQPCNGFLQQQTNLSINGTPYWPAPRPAVDSTFFCYDAATDTMHVTVDVPNPGSAAFTAPFHITAYRNAAGSAVKYTHAHPYSITPGDTVRITFGIPDYLAVWGAGATPVIRVNDTGNGFSEQAVCDSVSRDAPPPAGLLLAHSDRATAAGGLPVAVAVLANDTVPAGCRPGLRPEITRQAVHGTATVSGDSIRYTSATGFAGYDTVAYRIACGANASTAHLVLYVAQRPDNISGANCFVNPPTTAWSIREVPTHTTDQVHNLGPLTVGDLDGRDTTLIIGFLDYHGSDVAAHSYQSHGLKLFYFDGTEQRVKLKRSFPFKDKSGTAFYASTISSPAIARYNGKGYIVVAQNHATDLYLYAFDTDGTCHWRSSEHYTSDASYFATIINIADFNHDGIPEVYAGNRIFSLATGELLCNGGSHNTGALYHNGGDASMAADIVPGGNMELCAGTQIYSVTIPQGATTSSGCSLSPIADMELPAAAVPSNAARDGATQVVDIDGDGALEVVVVTRHTAASGQPVVVYVWKPLPGNASRLVGKYTTPVNSDYYSIPMIGNIDRDTCPEIVYIGDRYHMYALDYAPGNAPGDRLVRKWTHDIDDESSCTGMSLFDFNNDSISEIVYRDEHTLYIIDGNEATPHTEASFDNVHSYTLREYPVIADVDNDGQAEIVVSGGLSLAERYNGYVRVFKSNGSPWAPARKVWNQYAYNATNVNDDATVPRWPLHPATFFAGVDHLVGTPDDVQPYNNFRQQQTILSHDGTLLWLTPDLRPENPVFEYFNDGDSLRVTLTIRNRGDEAAAAPLCVGFYRNEVSAAAFACAVSAVPEIPPAAAPVHTLVLPNFSQLFGTGDSLILRLNDCGGARYVQLECDTANNALGIRLSHILQTRSDTRTVQKYHWTEIDVLANDALPDALFAGPFSLMDSVVRQPVGGTLSAAGSGRNSRLVYLNHGTDSLPGHVDSLVYRFRLHDAAVGRVREFRATAYIYILDETHGASACSGGSFTATLREAPAGTGFEWYAVADTAFLSSGSSYAFGTLAGDASRLVKPDVPDAAAPWNRAGGFPPGLLTVYAAGAASHPMRWTGQANTDWHNPANWVEETVEGWEQPVLWSPSACTDVVISSGAPHFPELTDSAWCRRITVQDRALLKNPHALNYDSARVELKLKATERDRFVMWSAPLRDMYSGDYHFKNASGEPRWGDVAMNYFQRANPDNAGSVAQANMFTATFGSPGDALRPGLAFNLRVTGTDLSRASSWTFPQSETSYAPPSAPGSTVYNTPRTLSHRFITDGLAQDAAGRFDLPVYNDAGGSHLVQVVNPYLAWLNADSFLVNNDSKLAAGGYLIWDGDVNSGFTAVKFTDDMRYLYTGPATFSASPEYIAPLQSFFVAKENGTALLSPSSVRMSPAWTVTRLSGSGSGTYVLRASEAESGVLRIRAVQGSRAAYAALHFDKLAAVPEYRGREDVRALFSDASPLAVYVLTALREPLAISADGDYHTHTTALGLRLPESGEARLEFAGMERFGHDVFLLDRERNVEVSLQQTGAYSFTVVKPAGASTLELNDRFVLRMEYTGVGSRSAEERQPEVTVVATAGYIHVRSLSGRIDRVDIYNVPGMLVAAAAPAGVNELNIPVAGAQTYLVKVETSGQTVVKKIFVK